MTLQPLDEKAFGQLKQNDPGYYTGRWPYLSTAVQMATEVPVERVLELGPYRRPLLLGSDIMDKHDYLAAGEVNIKLDATKTPWPIEDNAYDLFVALQVWEHLGRAQAEAFREVRRIAKRAVLSFPFEWKLLQDKNDCHYDISMSTIKKWTCNIRPQRTAVVSRPDANYKRLVCLFVF